MAKNNGTTTELGAETSSETEATPQVEQDDTITVKVSAAISSYGGAFYDPETRLTLGSEPVVTPKTYFVIGQLNAKHLIEV